MFNSIVYKYDSETHQKVMHHNGFALHMGTEVGKNCKGRFGFFAESVPIGTFNNNDTYNTLIYLFNKPKTMIGVTSGVDLPYGTVGGLSIGLTYSTYAVKVYEGDGKYNLRDHSFRLDVGLHFNFGQIVIRKRSEDSTI